MCNKLFKYHRQHSFAPSINYAHQITVCPNVFSNLPTALICSYMQQFLVSFAIRTFSQTIAKRVDYCKQYKAEGKKDMYFLTSGILVRLFLSVDSPSNSQKIT